MNYTGTDIDKILEASEKATKGSWVCLPSAAIYRDGDLIAQAHVVISHCGDSERMSNAELIAGAPILAEEVKRLRAELHCLQEIVNTENKGQYSY